MGDLKSDFEAVVIGGGFFGCSLAIQLIKKHKRVLILEMGTDILERASYANQARVHNGYHYPRSLLTAMRSRVNFPRFVHDYADCIFSEFEQYYAIGRNFSKVTATQYRIFMERIGAEVASAPKSIMRLANPALIEDIFLVKEYAFNAIKLRNQLSQNLSDLGISIWFCTKARRLEYKNGRGINIQLESVGDQGRSGSILATKVYNCTYSHLNQVLQDSQVPLISLKHEITEMALLEIPDDLQGIGVTVMCGPFFSFMPFPSTRYHTLSHVRYTPHNYWIDNSSNYYDPYDILDRSTKKSYAIHMLKDAQRFFPLLNQSQIVDSLWEVKTVLPSSEVDDSRPILLKKNYGMPGLTCILGGKIDNIYDVFDELEGELN